MSTRAPFFSSGARQEPRANGDLQEKASVQLSGDQTNALHCDQDMLADAPEKDTDDVNNNPSAETNIQHKPLNVNGLIRSRTYPKPPQRILLNGGNIPRPGTADLKSDGQHFVPHTTTIAAPMPFKASRIAPPLLLNPSNTSRPVSPLNFKAPAPPYIHQNGESFSNNAHIPTDSQDSSHEDLTVQLRSINSLGASRNMAASILAGKDANNTGHRIQYTQGKRRQNDANNGGQLDQYAKHLKRFKGDNSLVRRDGDKPEADPSLSRESCGANFGPEYGWNQGPSRGTSEKLRSDIDSEENRNSAYSGAEVMNTQQDPVAYSGALDGILGRDVNTYVEEHLLEKYEQALNKWGKCSLEEWSAGAEEIKSKFYKILDFVKEHIDAKVNLYASLDKKIELHESALTGREEMLTGAQTRLVHESEGVLGRSLGM